METSQEISFLMILLPLVGILFLIAIGVVLMYQQFQKNIILQQLKREEMNNEHQRELLRKMVKVQEKERKRIAQDLHDELGAALSIARMQLKHLENDHPNNEEQIRKTRELIETTLTSTRRISHQLMPLQLKKLGLEKALMALLDKARDSGKCETNIAVGDKCSELPWLVQIGVYRIYSELINNSLKHAEAKSIDLSLHCDSEQLFCRYADDGSGIDSTQKNNGLGMKSIENRIKALYGHWKYGNREKGGFYAQINLPLNHKNPNHESN